MLTEIQKIILTCLLGPEDPNGFKKFQQRKRYEKWALAHPEDLVKSRVRQREREKETPRVFTEEERKQRREREKNRRLLHGDEMRSRAAAKYAENPEPHKAASRTPAMRAQRARRLRQRRIDSPEEIRGKDRVYRKNRLESDPTFKILTGLRSRQSKEIRRAGGKKGARTMELTGCTFEELWIYLEARFKPGMTKQNWGPVWHIDHIKPCAAFNLADPEQQRICFHWTNLQPLFAAENLKKGDKYVMQ